MATPTKNAAPSKDVGALAERAATAVGIDPALYKSLIMNGERSFKGWAKSPMGAEGPAQLMPHTAAGLSHKYGVNTGTYYGNLLGGALYLKEQLQRFKDPALAVAAYNAGPGAVQVHGGVPPYKETQDYVTNVMNGLGAPRSSGSQSGEPSSAPNAGIQGAPGKIAQPIQIPGLPGDPGTSLAALLSQAAPSNTTVGLLQKLGGNDSTAADVAQRAQEPIPMPQQAVQASAAPASASSGGQETSTMPLSRHLQGNLPMVVGGQNPYTHLQFAGHVDFQHVNPRLLDALNKEAAKRNVTIQVISGYRSNQYSAAHGGFAGDPHTRGVAIDAYINGHPIGDVIGPDEWAKYGIRSGNTPGFYKGKPDPEHLDLIGIPVKSQGGAQK